MERELITIGEAVNGVGRLDEMTGERIESARSIVDFRNLVVHGYFAIRHETVWEILHVHVPRLRKDARSLLSE